MSRNLYTLRELPWELFIQAGGKGAALGRLAQRDLPVPGGFVALPAAFENGVLTDAARAELAPQIAALANGCTHFAVRSSGLNEDSAGASFAGAYATLLNIPAELDSVAAAMEEVAASAHSARVQEYCRSHGIAVEKPLAIVVQRMLTCEYSGVLFTANPVSGSHINMIGNFVRGQGGKLVSGMADAHEFTLTCPSGKYVGEKSIAKYAFELFTLARQAETLFGTPQDIEWAIEDGSLFLVQSRPITTLQTVHYNTYEINESIDGDFLWTSNHVGEALPDVMTPFTWSILRELDLECQQLHGLYLWSGNLCGRAYSNVSLLLSALEKGGIRQKRDIALLAEMFGEIPAQMSVPRYPLKRSEYLFDFLTHGKKNLKRMRTAQKNSAAYLVQTPLWYADIQQKLAETDRRAALLRLWNDAIRPYLSQLWAVWLGGVSDLSLAKLRKRLLRLVDETQASLICSGFSGALASLGPLLGLAELAAGTLSLEEYSGHYGHRSVHEFEVAYPYPADDPEHLLHELEEYKAAGVDVHALLKRQQERAEQAQAELFARYPHKAARLRKELAAAQESAKTREALRGEFVKVFRVMRLFLLKAGEVCGIGEDIFFLYAPELPKLLTGSTEVLEYLPQRRTTFENYRILPPFPRFIRGRFDPMEWMRDDERNHEYFDATVKATPLPTVGDIAGFAASAGQVEGIARVLHSFEAADTFQKGEILVTGTTNVGWTILLPKAAAIVTDIGAPLSHAAIVARELGIPAVLGCGSATQRIHTGDRLLVDGGSGLVRILEPATSQKEQG